MQAASSSTSWSASPARFWYHDRASPRPVSRARRRDSSCRSSATSSCSRPTPWWPAGTDCPHPAGDLAGLRHHRRCSAPTFHETFRPGDRTFREREWRDGARAASGAQPQARPRVALACTVARQTGVAPALCPAVGRVASADCSMDEPGPDACPETARNAHRPRTTARRTGHTVGRRTGPLGELRVSVTGRRNAEPGRPRREAGRPMQGASRPCTAST
jgi:hypothetical protein